MKNLNKFETLIKRARSESAPSVDVTDSVIAILAAEHDRLENISDRPLMSYCTCRRTPMKTPSISGFV